MYSVGRQMRLSARLFSPQVPSHLQAVTGDLIRGRSLDESCLDAGEVVWWRWREMGTSWVDVASTVHSHTISYR